MKKKMKLFILTGPAAYSSFNPESKNSSSCYRELHNQAPSLDARTKKNEKTMNLSHSHGQLPSAASTQSLKIQALVTESFII
jgi:hypothetical protein